jgi:30S ribosomal protein S31
LPIRASRQSFATAHPNAGIGAFCIFEQYKKNIMGRGDKKTKKGKIFKGSFGKSRPAKPAKKSASRAAKSK